MFRIVVLLLLSLVSAFGQEQHQFLDKENVSIFAGVVTVHALDVTSTWQFRRKGHSESLLSNSIVDNKAGFVLLGTSTAAVNIGASYYLHKTGHHRLERIFGIAGIAATSYFVVHNYSIGETPCRYGCRATAH